MWCRNIVLSLCIIVLARKDQNVCSLFITELILAYDEQGDRERRQRIVESRYRWRCWFLHLRLRRAIHTHRPLEPTGRVVGSVDQSRYYRLAWHQPKPLTINNVRSSTVLTTARRTRCASAWLKCPGLRLLSWCAIAATQHRWLAAEHSDTSYLSDACYRHTAAVVNT